MPGATEQRRGRTTLGGEGLQHQDGVSHMIAATVPNCRAYDPAEGFGRSDTRAALRRFFEVDSHHIVIAALHARAQNGNVAANLVEKAIQRYAIDVAKCPRLQFCDDWHLRGEIAFGDLGPA